MGLTIAKRRAVTNIQVLLTPTITVTIGIIAYRQWKTAHSKLADIE